MNTAVKPDDSMRTYSGRRNSLPCRRSVNFPSNAYAQSRFGNAILRCQCCLLYVKAITHCEKNGRIVNSITAGSSLAIPFVFTVFFVMNGLA